LWVFETSWAPDLNDSDLGEQLETYAILTGFGHGEQRGSLPWV